MKRHFLDLDGFDTETLTDILDLGAAEKAGAGRHGPRPLAGRTLAMIFEKPSTRTRVSFEVAIRQLGGDAVVLEVGNTQIGRGETVADTARVLSRYADVVMFRTGDESKMHELAGHAGVPVINGLTRQSHPCQVMADLMTARERKGRLSGLKWAWLGDGNNMAVSLIHAAARFDFGLTLGCPAGFEPPRDTVEWARRQGADIRITEDPDDAATDADVMATDTWTSMGDGDPGARRAAFAPYQVNTGLMRRAAPDAIFMHCLPAHRGEEVTDAVIDSPASVVFDAAENRLHVQKGILLWCLRDGPDRADA